MTMTAGEAEWSPRARAAQPRAVDPLARAAQPRAADPQARAVLGEEPDAEGERAPPAQRPAQLAKAALSPAAARVATQAATIRAEFQGWVVKRVTLGAEAARIREAKVAWAPYPAQAELPPGKGANL